MSAQIELDWKNLPFDFNQTGGYAITHYRQGKWTPFEVSTEPFLRLHVAAGVLHYSQAFFEGLRCFTHPNGKRYVFRVKDNAARFAQSAGIMCMPELPTNCFLEGIKLAANISRSLQPPCGSGASLYLRSFMIATGAQLGVRRSSEHAAIFYASPVGPYFKGGFNTMISLFLTNKDRVALNSTGNAKAGGNYAATIPALEEALANGCNAPLFTQPPEHQTITETHASNFACVINGALVTPAQNSFILNSVTRRSAVQICRDLSIIVEERDIGLSELPQIKEAFCLGTGATIAPVGKFRNEQGWLETGITDPTPGTITTLLYERLTAIQQGTKPDIHGWNYLLD
jgi:branched-chain amino acid aminotransferase